MATLGRALSTLDISDDLVEVLTFDLIRLADRHWVAPLLAHRLTQTGVISRLPEAVSRELRHQLCFEAAFDLAVTAEIRTIAAACHRHALPAFLMKGAALAYTHYPAPNLRPRLDTDLLIHERDRVAVASVLQDLGYDETPAVSGTATVHQTQFVKPIAGGLPHAIDLHWKIVNPVVFADLLTVEEIARDSVAVPGLHPDARALHPVHGLVLLAIHRVAHHEPALNLLGLYDIHLVAAALADAEWSRTMALAEERGVAQLTAGALSEARSLYATPLPLSVQHWIADAARRPLPEAFAPFMVSGRRVVDVIASDFRASRGWARARVLRERLLPPASYMRARYAIERRWLLPYFYLRRVVSGVPRVLRRGGYR